VTIALFNVITAMFLESTMTAAQELNFRKQQERIHDKKLWSKGVSILIRKLLEGCGYDLPLNRKLSESVDEIMEAQVDRRVINALVVEDVEASKVLDDLDVDKHDHARLGDILDSGHQGCIGILDFVNGLRRLRGNSPTRSDMVGIDLMVQDLQEQCRKMAQDIQRLLPRRSEVGRPIQENTEVGRPIQEKTEVGRPIQEKTEVEQKARVWRETRL